MLIELLAKEGFLIVATPYSLSFDHTVSARGIHNRFSSCLDYISTTGFGVLSAQEISSLPVYSVGHRYDCYYSCLDGKSLIRRSAELIIVLCIGAIKLVFLYVLMMAELI